MSSLKLPKFIQQHNKKSNAAQFFLALLLVLLGGYPCFYLRGSMGLTVSLAIGGAVLMAGEVAVGLSEWFL